MEHALVAFELYMDDDERDGHSGAGALRGPDPVEAGAVRAEGLDPDDPTVRAALDLVRWELELIGPGSRKPPGSAAGGPPIHRK
jgi:hypothetical protein